MPPVLAGAVHRERGFAVAHPNTNLNANPNPILTLNLTLTTMRYSPGVVPPVFAGPIHLQRGIAVAHVDADMRRVAEPRQPGRRQGLEPRRRPAQVQAVADVQQVAHRAVVQPVPARCVGGTALIRSLLKGSLCWALLK